MPNELFEAIETLPLECQYDDIKNIVLNLIHEDLYSYFVGCKDETIRLKVCISSIKEYNTINQQEAKDTIITAIVDYVVSLSNAKCICFKQPPIDLIIKLYQPMLKKMVDKIHMQWKMFEYDDLVSMANLITVKLYRQGYYVNKKLIWTSLNNEVLVQCRKLKYQPVMVSIYDEFQSIIKTDNEELRYGDILGDLDYQEEKEKKDEQQLEKYIFEQVKEIIIDKIGERQWDQLWRDYGKGHTTNRTQAAMRRIKGYFEELGLTRQDFINYYRR